MTTPLVVSNFRGWDSNARVNPILDINNTDLLVLGTV